MAPFGQRLLPRKPGVRSRALVAAAVAVLLGLATTAMVTSSVASEEVGAVPVSDSLASALVDAAKSCPALTPARLAAQVMAATKFTPTEESGISGLTAAEWATWIPADTAVPSDATASLLALAHLTCDLVGQVRVAGIPDDLWRLAVAAYRSSVSDVRAAEGVPASAAEHVDQVESYALWYAQQPGLSVTPLALGNTSAPAATASPTVTATTTGTPTPTSTASPTSTSAAATTAAAPTTFQYPRFNASTGLRLSGSAAISNGRLVLVPAQSLVGCVWSTTMIDTTRSFTTSFVALNNAPTDGLAMVIQTQGLSAAGHPGGGIGYGNRPTDSLVIRPSIAVELDTWNNYVDGIDPGTVDQHIAVTANGDISNHLAFADPGFSLTDQPVYVWVSYDAATRMLAVYAAQTSTRPTSPLLTYGLDLKSSLGARQAYIGFTGATGGPQADTKESIISWSFTGS